MSQQPNWNTLSKLFHWLTALIIISAIVLAYWAAAWHDLGGSRATQYQLYMLHKSLGLTALALALPRLLWRLLANHPAALPSHAAIERKAASAVHLLLYVLLFALPITGWLLNSAADVPLKYFSLLPVPALTDASAVTEKWFGLAHLWLGWLLITLLLLHIGGALKHHWLDSDVTLTRMLPGVLSARVWVAIILPLVAAIPISIAVLEWRAASQPHDHSTHQHAPTAETAVETAHGSGDAQAWVMAPEAKSELGFAVEVMGELVEGRFKTYLPVIRFDPNNLEQSSLVVSINTGSADTGSSTRDELLPEPEWFAIAQFPKARFRTLSIRADSNAADGSGQAFIADAELTIRDKTQALQFPFRWVVGEKGAMLLAEVMLNRRDYDVGLGEWVSAETVAHEVKVNVSLFLETVSP